MSVGFGRISKGLFQRSIENVANNANLRSDFLATLQRTPTTVGEDWIDFLIKHGGLDRASADYVRNDWLRFWQPAYPPDMVEEMLRQSLIQAINLADQHKSGARNPPMPIECHWIWTDKNDKFEVLVTYNERQVTRILLTPPPPTELNFPLHFLAPYFIVKPRRDIISELELEPPEQPGYAGARGDPGKPSEVVTVQLKSVR